MPPTPKLLRISPEDNVAVATAAIEPGQTFSIDDVSIVAVDRVATGHKMALTAVAAGEKVIKYGAPIGSAICDIQPGQHVHTHNLKSDYLPTYTLDGANPYLRDE